MLFIKYLTKAKARRNRMTEISGAKKIVNGSTLTQKVSTLRCPFEPFEGSGVIIVNNWF